MSKNEIARPSDRLLSIRDLKAHFTLSRSTVWRYEKAGQFPRAIKISERRKAWRESDIMQWLNERAGEAQGRA